MKINFSVYYCVRKVCDLYLITMSKNCVSRQCPIQDKIRRGRYFTLAPHFSDKELPEFLSLELVR